MSEPTASIRYTPPAIVRRDTIEGLLINATRPSDLPPKEPSDVNLKENIRPVRW